MKNRLVESLPASGRQVQSWKEAIPESRQPVQRRIGHRNGDVESYVREHPVAAIGAAFCIGVFLAWVIRKK